MLPFFRGGSPAEYSGAVDGLSSDSPSCGRLSAEEKPVRANNTSEVRLGSLLVSLLDPTRGLAGTQALPATAASTVSKVGKYDPMPIAFIVWMMRGAAPTSAILRSIEIRMSTESADDPTFSTKFSRGEWSYPFRSSHTAIPQQPVKLIVPLSRFRNVRTFSRTIAP